jgi:hypothetical protein
MKKLRWPEAWDFGDSIGELIDRLLWVLTMIALLAVGPFLLVFFGLRRLHRHLRSRRSHDGAIILRFAWIIVLTAAIGAGCFAWWAIKPPHFVTGETTGLTVKEKADVLLMARDISLKIAAGIAAIAAGLLAWGRLELTRDERSRDTRRMEAEGFSNANDQLARDSEISKIAGIYSLELIYESRFSPAIQSILQTFVTVGSRDSLEEAIRSPTGELPKSPESTLVAAQVLLRHRWPDPVLLQSPYLVGGRFDVRIGTDLEIRDGVLRGTHFLGEEVGEMRIVRTSFQNCGLTLMHCQRMSIIESESIASALSGDMGGSVEIYGGRGDLFINDDGLQRVDMSGADPAEFVVTIRTEAEPTVVGGVLNPYHDGRVWGSNYRIEPEPPSTAKESSS